MGEKVKKHFSKDIESIIKSTKENAPEDKGEFMKNTVIDDVNEELDETHGLSEVDWNAKHLEGGDIIGQHLKTTLHDPSKYSNRFDIMLKKNSDTFYYHYGNRNFLSIEECRKLIDDFETNAFVEWTDEVDAYHETKTFEGEEKDRWRVCDIKWLRYYQKNYEWLYERLDKKIKEINEKVFQFDLTNPIVIEDLQFTKYNEGGLYKKHTDWNGMDPQYSTRKLSFSINLSCPNKDWKGDGLSIDVPGNTEDDISPWVDKSQGSITFFPSFLNHEAHPVQEGSRYVIVGWIHGNPFR
jgi:predicted 2-oxoglutarate/Fe(II)-dependent dioxygenase YbiX